MSRRRRVAGFAHRARSMPGVLRAHSLPHRAFEGIPSAVLVKSGRLRYATLGDPSASAPAPPSAMDHDDDRSLSLGTEVSASVPPPSPLTGCYLLAVVGEPHTHEHKEIILQRLVKGNYLHVTVTAVRKFTFSSFYRRFLRRLSPSDLAVK